MKKMKKSRKKIKLTKKVIVLMICKKHEEYKATYPPKLDCLVCWKIYATRMQRSNMVLKIKLKELKNAWRR
ncbi:hypothetical protein LCGC14_1076740 [marine sediment metagenome]|uniref:Uncharacterized protein n=1 Tax=marine sediment metagenome TaxID=412755 RepID=A0A0F9N3Z1_9ZZZZ